MKHGMILPSSLEFAVLPNSYKGSMSHAKKKPVLPQWTFMIVWHGQYSTRAAGSQDFSSKKLSKSCIFQISMDVNFDRRQTIDCEKAIKTRRLVASCLLWSRKGEPRLRHRTNAFYAFLAKSSFCARRLLLPQKYYVFLREPLLALCC